jgi:hypothetical protein
MMKLQTNVKPVDLNAKLVKMETYVSYYTYANQDVINVW